MSAVVADTHSLLWYLNDSAKLSETARAEFETAEQNGEPIYVAAISLIEIRYLVEKGREITERDFQIIVAEINNPATALTFIELTQPMTIQMALIPREIVPDMPDRIIAATALVLKVPLISKDAKLQNLRNVKTIW